MCWFVVHSRKSEHQSLSWKAGERSVKTTGTCPTVLVQGSRASSSEEIEHLSACRLEGQTRPFLRAREMSGKWLRRLLGAAIAAQSRLQTVTEIRTP